jgi:hypothetical protein
VGWGGGVWERGACAWFFSEPQTTTVTDATYPVQYSMKIFCVMQAREEEQTREGRAGEGGGGQGVARARGKRGVIADHFENHSLLDGGL